MARSVTLRDIMSKLSSCGAPMAMYVLYSFHANCCRLFGVVGSYVRHSSLCFKYIYCMYRVRGNMISLRSLRS